MPSSTTISMLHLGHEVDLVLGAPIGLGVAALAAEAADLADGDAGDAGRLDGVLHVVELERFDDCGDELHVRVSVTFTLDVAADELRVGEDAHLRQVEPGELVLLVGADAALAHRLRDGVLDLEEARRRCRR